MKKLIFLGIFLSLISLSELVKETKEYNYYVSYTSAPAMLLIEKASYDLDELEKSGDDFEKRTMVLALYHEDLTQKIDALKRTEVEDSIKDIHLTFIAILEDLRDMAECDIDSAQVALPYQQELKRSVYDSDMDKEDLEIIKRIEVRVQKLHKSLQEHLETYRKLGEKEVQ